MIIELGKVSAETKGFNQPLAQELQAPFQFNKRD